MALKRVRLELARSAKFPQGSPSRGYLITAPLTADGHLDVAAWPAVAGQCTLSRFWQGEEDRAGVLEHTAGGAWAFSYAPGEEDDEAVYHLEDHVFRVGEYVTISEPDGRSFTYRVAFIR